MNLYNKIYNAINEGIQKALLIDPDQNDVSINYSYHKIDNSIDPLLMEFVDLGLPSGTLWCDHNLGATCADTSTSWYGDYYAWGEIEPKSKYTSDNYKGNNINLNNDIVNIKYTNKYNSKITEKVKMPTKEQCEELKNCYNEWVTDYNGVDGLNGRIFTGYNGNILFIPATGYLDGSVLYHAGSDCYLWTSSLYSVYSGNAWDIYFDSDDISISYGGCYFGLSVRGVCS